MTEEMINISDTSEEETLEEISENSLLEEAKKSWAEKLKDKAKEKLRDVVKPDKAVDIAKGQVTKLARKMYHGKKRS
tara:strand:+ start:570 stop:800 length:231 start_codon:yes stop_codon:yes gene_type:complete